MRNLKNGTAAPELTEAQTLTIKTKCPQKWLLIDMETGEVYSPYSTQGSLQWERQHGLTYDESGLVTNNA